MCVLRFLYFASIFLVRFSLFFISVAKILFYPAHRYFYFILALLCLQSLPARACDTSPESKLHVLIDEGRIDNSIGEVDRSVTSSSYSVIEADRFRNSFVNLPEILEQEVGVQTRASGGEGSLTTVVLRGASNEQVIIYLDGVPLNDASGGPVDLSFIPLNSIERIEIYRGSTPLELGSPSIGGAVNIITRKVSARSAVQPGSDQLDTNTQLSASAASFQTYKLSATSALSYKKDDVLFNASYLQSKNDFSFVNDNGTQLNPADDRVEKRNNDGVKQLSLLANWKHRISTEYDTELRLDVLDREKQIPGISNSPDSQTSLDTQTFNILGQLNAHGLWSKNTNANVKLFATGKQEVFDDSLAQIGFFNQHTENISRKAGSQLFIQINQQQMQWKLLTGISRETFRSESTQARVESGKNTRSQMEVSAENVAYFDQQRFILTMVLRSQWLLDELSAVSDGLGTVTPAFNKSYQLISPQLGAKYRFNKRTYATANVGLYNRAPSFYEIFGGDGLLLGNPDLKQETSLNTDLGFTYDWYKPFSWWRDTEVYAGVFYNRVENLIVRIFNGQGVGVPKNISDAVIRGFESSIKLVPAEHHSFNANISLIDSINKTDIRSFSGRYLPGYYRQSFSLRYSYSLNRWLYSVEADIKRNMYYDRSNLLKGDDVNLINLALRRYFQHASIDFRINNILNENIEYFRNRPTPGLSLSLTYNHTF